MQSPNVPLIAPHVAPVAPAQVAQWDPHHTNAFVVSIDSTLKLFRWTPKLNRVQLVAAQSDVSQIKCMDWSPHPLYPDLMAVGHTNGTVELLRMGENVLPAAQSTASPSKITLNTLGPQHPRACLSMSFSTVSPSYLAAGFEKSRGQHSLHVWDIERVAKTLAGPAPSPDDPAVRAYKAQTALQPEDTAEWNPSAPARIQQTRMLTSTTATNSNDGSNSVRRYAFGEAVMSVAFLPDHAHMLSVGTGLRSLRLYDIRKARESAEDVETQAIHGICFDPFDSTRMASFGEDGVVEFWDTRNMSKPALSLQAAVLEDDDPHGRRFLTHIAFSPVRRGLFGTLANDSRHVRFWSLMGPDVRPIVDDDEEKDAPRPIDEQARDYLTAKSDRQLSLEIPLVAGHVRSGRKLPRDVSNFTFVPSLDGTSDHDFIMTTSRDRGVDIWRSPVQPLHVWSTRGELAIASGGTYRLAPDESLAADVSNIDPWSIDIERASTPAPPSPRSPSLESASLQLRDSLMAVETMSNQEEHDQPRIGRVPFPVTESPSQPPSSLSTTRRLFSSSRQQSHTPTRRRSPSRNTLRTRPPVASIEGRPNRAIDQHLAVTGSLKLFSSRPLGEMAKVMRTDISEVMRGRVLCGYGVDSMTHNARVSSQLPTPEMDELPRLWLWLEASNYFADVKSSKVFGFDFAYQGVLSIWEGFSPLTARPSIFDESGPTDSSPASSLAMNRSPSGRGPRRLSRSKSGVDPARLQYELAVEAMTNRRSRGVKKDLPKAAVTSHRPTRRQYALGLCDWDLNDAEFDEQIQLWEEDRFTERAACWAIFLKKVPLAIEILLRSRDENMVMLSGTIQLLLQEQKAQSSDGTARRSEWREHVERLMVRLGGVYTRAMLSILVGESWMDLLVSETTLPLRERLAIALLFLPDDELSKYFRSLVEDMNRGGDIGALLITGLNPAGLEVIQAYIDSTGDIQTAASLVSFVTPARWRSERRPKDPRPERWVETYRNLLDSWQLFHHRVQFDLLRGEINTSSIRDGEVVPFEWIPRQMEVRCNYCNKLVNSQQPMEPTPAGGGVLTAVERVRADFCPNCRRKLPRCSVCLFTVGLVNEDDRDASLDTSVAAADTSDDAMVFCQACRHGGHSAHILDWFFGGVEGKTHSECAIADCDCHCTEFF